MWQRGWGALSSEEGGGESFPELYINKPGLVGEALAGAGACAQQPGVGKLV
jgi:hypothetical protein